MSPSKATQRVLDVSTASFARTGIAGTSMRDLATELGIRAPSLYSHFTSKRALVDAVVTPYVEDTRALVIFASRKPTVEEFVATYCMVLAKHRDPAKILHLDPAMRSNGERRMLDEQLGNCLHNFGVQHMMVDPLLAFIRQPWLSDDTVVPPGYGDLLAVAVATFAASPG